MSLTPFFAAWLALGAIVLGLAIYRKMLSTSRDDEFVHLGPGDGKLIERQVDASRKLDAIDRWGKALTLLVVIYGVVLAALHLYGVWQGSLELH